MAKFRQVYTEFWDDAKVTEEMTPEDKLFYLYLLTNPNTTQTGIYQITKKKAAFELGHSIESANSLFDRFENYHKLIRYNPETRELAIKNWGKYNLNRGGKPMLDCVRKELGEVKDRTLIHFVGDNVKNAPIKELYDTYHDTSTTRGQEKEEEEEQEEEQELDDDNNPHTFYEKNFGMLKPFVIESITEWSSEMSDELVVAAMKLAIKNNKSHFGYCEAILKDWQSKGVRTIKDARSLQRATQPTNQSSITPISKPDRQYNYGF